MVAHELGHVRNWDMVLMTLANLVPLLLFYLYDISIRLRNLDSKARAPGWAVAIGAYILYIVSEYIVLWFGRHRANTTPTASPGRRPAIPTRWHRPWSKSPMGWLPREPKRRPEEEEAKEKDQKRRRRSTRASTSARGRGAALNIADHRTAVSLVIGAGRGDGRTRPGACQGGDAMGFVESVARWFELNSTHPLTARRVAGAGRAGRVDGAGADGGIRPQEAGVVLG